MLHASLCVACPESEIRLLCRETAASASLTPAISILIGDLQRYASLLDSVVFRELWRAVAVATTRTVFNNVVTEARFSQQVQKCQCWLSV